MKEPDIIEDIVDLGADMLHMKNCMKLFRG
jgi:hypothetical protein